MRSGGTCPWDRCCRTKVIVYRINCKICDKYYIGSLQNAYKQRTQMHIQNIRDAFMKGKTSSTLANHITKHLYALRAREEINVDNNLTAQIRNLMEFKVLWTGNPISTVNTFGSDKCELCMEERLILTSELLHSKGKKCLNRANEIFGPCRHKPKFHRYCITGTSNFTHLTLMSGSSRVSDSETETNDEEEESIKEETTAEKDELETNWNVICEEENMMENNTNQNSRNGNWSSGNHVEKTKKSSNPFINDKESNKKKKK